MGSIVSGITDAIGLTNVGGQKYEARLAADAQRAAAAQAADEARFRPVNMTTAFGSSEFGFDPITQRLTSAGYTLSPEIAALRNQLLGAAPGALERGLGAYSRIAPAETAAQGLFNLGQQYISESPQAARQRYMEQQTALLDPIRQREEQRLGQSVFGRGRAGLNVGDVGQPDLYSLAAARRQQDLQLAAAADQAAQQQAQFGAGLFGTGIDYLNAVPAYQTAALSPFQTQLGLASTVEQLGQEPLQLGMQLGGAAADAGARAGTSLLQGGLAAAQTRQQGYNAANQQLNSLMQGALTSAAGMYGAGMGGGGMFGGGMGAASGYGMGSLGYGLGYGINPMGQQARMLAAQW